MKAVIGCKYANIKVAWLCYSLSNKWMGKILIFYMGKLLTMCFIRLNKERACLAQAKPQFPILYFTYFESLSDKMVLTKKAVIERNRNILASKATKLRKKSEIR